MKACINITIAGFSRTRRMMHERCPGRGYKSLRASSWRPAVPAARISANFNGRGPRWPRNGIACTAEAAEKPCRNGLLALRTIWFDHTRGGKTGAFYRLFFRAKTNGISNFPFYFRDFLRRGGVSACLRNISTTAPRSSHTARSAESLFWRARGAAEGGYSARKNAGAGIITHTPIPIPGWA